MKWVTRARPKTDRIACPWLIRRFIDPEAEILYVPTDQVLAVAGHESAHGFDTREARRLNAQTTNLVGPKARKTATRALRHGSWPADTCIDGRGE